MGILSSTAAAIVAGAAIASCYSPSLVDCTVSCSSASDCASGQVCGDDRLCAAPAVAGRCSIASLDAAPEPDAGIVIDATGAVASDAADAGDAAVVDAVIAVDATIPDAPPPLVGLRVRITGRGGVVVDGRGTCVAMGPGQADCTYEIPRDVAQTVRAFAVQPDQRFLSWTSTTCRAQAAVCTFTPVAPTALTASFGRGGGADNHASDGDSVR
jgi:hypothetical protein